VSSRCNSDTSQGYPDDYGTALVKNETTKALVRQVTIRLLPGVAKDYALETMLGLLIVAGVGFWILAFLR
jgi:hypothetical protein